MLSIALPNGSLEEGTLKLFEEANLKVLRAPRQHGAKIEDPRISRVTIMRPQHIPRLVEQGTYDLGVCGQDSILESDAKVSQTVRKRCEFDAERRETPRSAGFLAFRPPGASEST